MILNIQKHFFNSRKETYNYFWKRFFSIIFLEIKFTNTLEPEHKDKMLVICLRSRNNNTAGNITFLIKKLLSQ